MVASSPWRRSLLEYPEFFRTEPADVVAGGGATPRTGRLTSSLEDDGHRAAPSRSSSLLLTDGAGTLPVCGAVRPGVALRAVAP